MNCSVDTFVRHCRARVNRWQVELFFEAFLFSLNRSKKIRPREGDYSPLSPNGRHEALQALRMTSNRSMDQPT